jgi:hypothetical protein
MEILQARLDASVGGKLYSRIIDDGVELKVAKQNGEEITLLSPVVRCYRTHTVEFKTDANGNLAAFELVDSKGQHYRVPQVFDLTPDI